MNVLVLTISDRASRGEYKDLSGSAVEKLLREHWPGCHVERNVVADEREEILQAFHAHQDYDIILTTGGTGIGPRDITPDVTQEYCDRMIPGIAEVIRIESYKQTPYAMLSRAVAGHKGNTVIINMPGAARGAEFCTQILLPVLSHARDMLKGERH